MVNVVLRGLAAAALALWGTTREIGGGAVPLQPSSRIAAASRSSEFLDVFVIGLDGMLHKRS
ncbi:hypothetical protein ACWD6Q_33625 [Streptomyces nigra]|uniref:hypothetical protein n=1 Tax=Streptomyces nigra TaxID=1827580 RepID=UPI0036995D05